MVDLKTLSKEQLAKQLQAILHDMECAKSEDEQQRIIHDLHVHQIELEMQNRQLRETQKTLEDSRDLYSELYDFSPVSYVTLTDKGLIDQINLTGARLLGKPREQLTDLPLSIFMVKSDWQHFFNYLKQVLKSNTKLAIELHLKNNADTYRYGYVECIAVPGTQGKSRSCHCAIIDITERKRTEELLRQAHDELEQRVEKRTKGIKQANDQLQAEVAARKQMAEALQRSEVFEQLATGAALNDVLTSLVQNAEKHNPDINCSILFLDEKSDTLRLGAAPSLPEFFKHYLEGQSVVHGEHSCAAAAITGKRCVSEHPNDQPLWQEQNKLMKQAGYVSCWSEPLISSAGSILGCFAVYYRQPWVFLQADIDYIIDSVRLAVIAIEHQLSIDKLRTSEAELRGIMDSLQDMYYRTDIDGYILQASPFAFQITGYTAQELIGKHITYFWRYPEQRQAMLEQMRKNEGTVVNYQFECIRKDGKTLWASKNAHFHFDANGNIDGVEGTIHDISNIKQAQQQTSELLQQNRGLMQRLFLLQEKERRHLARDLHDEFGQWLTAIQVNTQNIKKLLGSQPDEVAVCIESIAKSASVLQSDLRRILQRLRPAVLDELGLVDSLQELVQQWRILNPHISCQFTSTGRLDHLGEILDITIYRLVQETLTNVSKHAQATQVTVDLCHKPDEKAGQDRIILNINDNGVGLSSDALKKGFGLHNMRERVLAAGGEISIQNLETSGVHILIEFDLAHKTLPAIP